MKSLGVSFAPRPAMAGFHTHRDFVAWQLAYELRRQVIPLCRRILQAKDFDLHRNLREAARSAPRNIAERFARFKHRDFAKFVRIAKGSEVEMLDHLQEAHDSGYLSGDELASLEHAVRKAIKAANGLIRYLDSTPDVPAVAKRKHQAPST